MFTLLHLIQFTVRPHMVRIKQIHRFPNDVFHGCLRISLFILKTEWNLITLTQVINREISIPWQARTNEMTFPLDKLIRDPFRWGHVFVASTSVHNGRNNNNHVRDSSNRVVRPHSPHMDANAQRLFTQWFNALNKIEPEKRSRLATPDEQSAFFLFIHLRVTRAVWQTPMCVNYALVH